MRLTVRPLWRCCAVRSVDPDRAVFPPTCRFSAVCLADPEFQAGGVDTGFVARLLDAQQRFGARRETMADVQIVETSLRDGNQCLWAALGVDTAQDTDDRPDDGRVGYKAIDFTTSTHMGVAVRYKKEDPWERIRLMAAAMPRTPLQFMSTGFRFISWETAIRNSWRSPSACWRATASAAFAWPTP